MEKKFWDIIESNFGFQDELDEDNVNIFDQFKGQSYTIMNVAPGIIVMIKDEFYGEE